MSSSRRALTGCAFLSLLLIAFSLAMFAPPAQESLADDSGDMAAAAADTWYLAEGCTGGDFETWVLVQNPGDSPVDINIDFMTEAGILHGLEVEMAPNSRSTFNVGTFVTTYDVSTKVTANGDIICERAMYWGDRLGGHCSIGVTQPQQTWYMAEGASAGEFETWVLVQNPEAVPAKIVVEFMTGSGMSPGPIDTIPAFSRRSYNVGEFVQTYEVSTKVTADSPVICERAVYWEDKLGGQCSIGVTEPAPIWYLAEGCTDGDFETWVLVQNPGDVPVYIDMDFMTGSGIKQGPKTTLPPYSRRSFNLGDYLTTYDVSTRVKAIGGDVICERAVYWDSFVIMWDRYDPSLYLEYYWIRGGGHGSIGVTSPQPVWYLAEGCSEGDFETWVLVQNPGGTSVTIDIDFMTGSNVVQGPVRSLPPRSRKSFNVGDYVKTYDVSTRITANGGIICERSVYWDGYKDFSTIDPSIGMVIDVRRIGGHNSIGYTP